MNDYYSEFPKPQVDERVQSLVSMVPPYVRMEVPLKVIEAEALQVTRSWGRTTPSRGGARSAGTRSSSTSADALRT